MPNQFTHSMAAKSDADLHKIVEERHRYEPEAALAAIEELERRQLLTPELLRAKAGVVESLNQNAEEATAQTKNPKRRSWKETLKLLTVSKEYFYTPIIIYVNVIIWILMVTTGVDAFAPSVESLVNWEGNLAALTLTGQPWRLLTSIFLHGGLFHLALNMFALLQVGAVLESHFGKHRYAFVYIITGIMGSILSVAFSLNVVSVGASGAIFGLYGLLVSLLTTKSLQTTAEERSTLLLSTLTFIGYNVLFGFTQAGIDNAAHIGGVLSGFIIGFLYYPFIRQQKKSSVLSMSLVGVVLIIIWAAPRLITNPYVKFNSEIETFSAKEKKALWMYEANFPKPLTVEAYRFRERLKTEGTDLWKENLALLNALNDMPSDLQERIDLLKRYCRLRIESCETMLSLTQYQSNAEMNHAQEVEKQLVGVIDSLRALNQVRN
jgi:rhomboid protease GluP